MKTIPLRLGKVALVDDEDYEYLMQWQWGVYFNHGNYYVSRKDYNEKGNRYTVWLHRVIMNTPSGLFVDHIDHNGLNNQKSNLRNCTMTENARNKISKGRVPFLGVYWTKNIQKYRAYIFVNKKKRILGTFKNPEDAAMVYDKAAKEHFGEFANLNFK